jgi:glycosyltransferase involved in cell wall biosynthesis
MSDVVASVVVPTYGRRSQLLNCLEALANQDCREPWEVVVVDDGSPEPVADAADAFAGRLPLRVIRQENAGPAAARNRGVHEARGEFIAFTDDDCLPEPGWLAELVHAARDRPGALVGGTTINGLTGELFASTSQMIVDLVYAHFNSDPEDAYFLTSNNMLCTRERFLALKGFDAGFSRAGAEDRDFCDRWRMAGWRIAWHPAARIEHRHSQTLRTFVDLHYRYGRGAYRYQAVRRERGSGTMQEDLGFHTSLPSHVWRELTRRRNPVLAAGVLLALVGWQVANAAGFALESVAARWRERPQETIGNRSTFR